MFEEILSGYVLGSYYERVNVGSWAKNTQSKTAIGKDFSSCRIDHYVWLFLKPTDVFDEFLGDVLEGVQDGCSGEDVSSVPMIGLKLAKEVKYRVELPCLSRCITLIAILPL